MYDFYFGEREEIEANSAKFLLSIKRMLPRWCNSIPDSEFIALHEILENSDLPQGCSIVETGSGASSIVLFYHALKNGGTLYSWDTNGSKLSFLRGLMNDTTLRVFEDQSVSKVWKTIAYMSTSQYGGIPILKELGVKVDACFLDSEHTWENLGAEVDTLLPLFSDRSIVAIDDGNYDYKNMNVAYVNMIRKKLGIAPIDDLEDNQTELFYKEVENVLKANFKEVNHLKDSYKDNYPEDLFWLWFQTDKEKAKELKMEKVANLEHRFDAWEIKR